jgi:lantibiotic modifying enzyme
MDVAELLTGFHIMYRRAHALHDELLAPGSPLWAFSSREIRFVFRATGDYTRLLHASLNPALLRNEVARSTHLEALYLVATPFSERPSFWPLLEAEHRAMDAMDIPRFKANTSSRNIVLDNGGVLSNYFLEPPIDRVMERLRRLSEDDLEQQSASIRGALQPASIH